MLSVQGTQSFLQLPRLAYTEYKKFEPLSCPDCSHDDPQEFRIDMVAQGRLVLRLTPRRVYGQL